MLGNTDRAWGSMIKALHWLTLVLVILAWWTMETRADFPKGSPERAAWANWHFINGGAIWVLTFFRVIWRFAQPTPRLMIARWQRILSHIVQGTLYLLLLAMPITGFLAVQLSGGSVDYFVFEVGGIFGTNEDLGHSLGEFHEDILWPLFLAFTTVHVVAALYHHFYAKDDVMRGMLWKKAERG